MSAWKAGIVAAMVWAVLITAIFYVHVEVYLKGRISRQADEALSLNYGRLAGFGLVVVGLLAYRVAKRREED